MHLRWTAAEIRAKADALEARAGRRITFAADTLVLVVEALRFFATEGLGIRNDGYSIEVWNFQTDSVTEHVGQIANFAAARAAFDAICIERPRDRVTLRQRGRVIDVWRDGLG